jgi:hypothetical protein
MPKERKPPVREPGAFEPVIREPQDQGGGGSQQGGGGIPPNQRGHSPDMRPTRERAPASGEIGGVTDVRGQERKQRGGQLNPHAGEQSVGGPPQETPENPQQRLAQRYELDRAIRNERQHKPQARGKRR